SCAFDLPTQTGSDSDHPRAEGEVRKVGVAIDSIAHMHRLLDGIPLDQVTTSMTINATASILLLLYQLVAEDNGVDPRRLGGTVQNDLLKEYIARGTYIYPPRPSMRIITDVFAYCNEHLPQWNTISISGYHIREAGSTAQQPEVNIVRTTVQAMAAVLGGTQSLHTNSFDEALGLPTEKAAKLALRTQQVIAHESGVVDSVDPLAGSYFVESLTDQIEAEAWRYIEKIDGMGGALAAIEAGYMQDEIEQAAFSWAKAVDDAEKVIVGVNRYVEEAPEPPDVFPIDPDLQRRQAERVQALRASRDQAAVDAALA